METNPISRLARFLAACIALSLSARAATFTVINTDDTGSGSLRQAVADAANTPGEDSINFAAGLSGQTITLGSEIILDSSVTIEASSLPAGLTIDGGPGTNRIFYVNPGAAVTLKHLTLTGGNGDGASDSNWGGAIFNDGTLTLSACTLFGNTMPSGISSGGGAIFSEGMLTLKQCTLSGNSALLGGAIYQFWGVGMRLTQCTISGNSAPTAGGGVYCDSFVTITNCIIAGNTGADDVFDGLSNNTYTGVNFIGSQTSSAVLGPPTLTGDPLLAPLGHYGGPTRTMPLKTGSPARNAAAVLSPAITADQRGFPIVGAPDIGAYEAGTFNSFATWSLEYAGSTLIFGNDNENDGAINGLEYATRRDPNASDMQLSPTLTPIELGGHTFLFRYQKDARDLRYIVQRSGDLGDANGWTEVYRYDTRIGQITENGVIGDENPATQFITLTDSATGPLLFWRLVIEQVP